MLIPLARYSYIFLYLSNVVSFSTPKRKDELSEASNRNEAQVKSNSFPLEQKSYNSGTIHLCGLVLILAVVA